MQGVGCADDLLYFKCPTTKQMPCPVNANESIIDEQLWRATVIPASTTYAEAAAGSDSYAPNTLSLLMLGHDMVDIDKPGR
jgi:hypothetical protein